jgi:hypothetical protein
MFSGMKDASPLAKAVVIFSAIFTISLGLCGLDIVVASHSKTMSGLLQCLGTLSAGGIVISIVGLLGVGVVALINSIVGSYRDN